jgi:anthranilate synthase/indole-3-glycerol phosphate synthase/phosphoribosylanthranilate isomerase
MRKIASVSILLAVLHNYYYSLFLVVFPKQPSVQAFTLVGGKTWSSSSNTNHNHHPNRIPCRKMTSSSLSSSTNPSTTTSEMDRSRVYTDRELYDALDRFYHTNYDYDDENVSKEQYCRHLYGYGDPTHQLSMLQKITATVLLDYEHYLQGDTSTSESTQDSSSSGAAAAVVIAPSMDQLSQRAHEFRERHGSIWNLQRVIRQTQPRMALAAEFKRASPSKGAINLDVNATQQGLQYAQAGADIISVLTEPRWFQGSLQDLQSIRIATTTTTTTTTSTTKNHHSIQRRPAILRKDFVVNEYMIAEAAAHGADTVLLIVAVLPEHVLRHLIRYARTAWDMEPLVEVHDVNTELDVAIRAGAKVIGVNNRNLHTFELDLTTTEQVAQKLFAASKHEHDSDQDDITLCALSGMSTADDVERYRQSNVSMCLIGESLMRAPDPAQAIADLYLDPQQYQQQQQNGSGGAGGAYTMGTRLIKVCGITDPEDARIACRAGANAIGIIFAEKSPRSLIRDPARAAAVAEAVRAFGERRQRIALEEWALPHNNDKNNYRATNPRAHLRASAQSISTKVKQRPIVVGVFQNQDPELIRNMIDQCGLDMVQLHGQEGMSAANAQNFGVPVIRVVDVPVDKNMNGDNEIAPDAAKSILASLTNDPAIILLDTSIRGFGSGGGTGVAFDWTIAQRVQDAGVPVIVAGGLTPDSVSDCVEQIRPFGIDVSSGVEESPGRKKHEKVIDFVKRAKLAAAEANKGF